MHEYPQPFLDLLRRRPVSYRGQVLHIEIEVIDASKEMWQRGQEWLKCSGYKIRLQPDVVTAYRGSWFGNATSFDMRRLVTQATMSRTIVGIKLSVKVNFMAQVLCAWNYIDLQVELQQFKSTLETGQEDSRLASALSLAKGTAWKADWRQATKYWS